jgi:23S rRNA (adenine2503-C2)-methyltransferase
MLSIHDSGGIGALGRACKLDPALVRRLRNAFCKRHLPAAAALEELPAEVRHRFAVDVTFHALTLLSRHDSAIDGATKLIFRNGEGLLLESVILRMTSGRTALCVSTQVGCAANCEFCATGKMGIARNLAADEMLDQLVWAGQLLAEEGRTVRNLVMMGMGEPLHNEAQLYAALDVLADPAAFNMNLKRVLISTVGIPAAMVRCARRFPDARLALSLHSATQAVREQIMPIARRYSLDELRAALVEVTAVQQHEVMIEYLLLAEINDSPEDAQALIEYVRGIPVHINLIPYNPIAEAPHLVASDPDRRAEFSEILKTAGLPVTTRYSLGADIAAACGQLVRQEHRLQTTGS